MIGEGKRDASGKFRCQFICCAFHADYRIIEFGFPGGLGSNLGENIRDKFSSERERLANSYPMRKLRNC